jgi:hypothetical protein
MHKVIRSIVLSAALLFLLGTFGEFAQETSVRLIKTVELPGYSGDFDHFATMIATASFLRRKTMVPSKSSISGRRLTCTPSAASASRTASLFVKVFPLFSSLTVRNEVPPSAMRHLCQEAYSYTKADRRGLWQLH